MPAADAAVANGAQENQQEQPAGGISSFIQTAFRMMFMWWAMRSVMNWMKPQQASKSTGQPADLSTLRNLWMPGQIFDVRVYMSPDDQLDFSGDSTKLLWEESALSYDWNEASERALNVTVPCPESLQKNGTMWAHIYFSRNGMSPDPKNSIYDKESFGKSFEMVKYGKQRIIKKKKNLIEQSFSANDPEEVADSATDDPEPPVEEEEPEPATEDQEEGWLQARLDGREKASAGPKEVVPIVGFWKPTLTLRLVVDFTAFQKGAIPPQMAGAVKLHQDPETLELSYFPVIYIDEFWVLSERMVQLNDTVKTLDLEISYTPISLWKWQMQSQMEQSMVQQQDWGLQGEGGSDDFKRLFIESNPILLAITMVVSVFHSVFDFLAFKNDVAFWKNNKDMTGLSVRTIFLNLFCSIVIFFYLWENETSWMILISSCVGIVIEFWKIFKAAKVTYGSSGGWFGVLPWVKVEDRQSYIDSGTSQYDKEAMRYLSYVLFPMIIGYSIYSLLYEEHKGWYQWVLGSLVGSVYTFGFILMCPQLYLNYKLKSVAHLPWRMMTYKALNTVIDDLFAFVIKMPMLHRISCFRDDVVFAFLLYQRWIYRVDYTRTNEFGYTPVQPGDEKNADETKLVEGSKSEKPKEISENSENIPNGISELDGSKEPAVAEEKSVESSETNADTLRKRLPRSS